MWISTIFLFLVGSLSAHPKGHLRGGDEDITCRGIQELRKAPLAILSKLVCHENYSKDECVASTMDVLKFCIDGLKIDVDCVEKAFEVSYSIFMLISCVHGVVAWQWSRLICLIIHSKLPIYWRTWLFAPG